MSQYFQQWGGRVLLLLIALVIASVSQARDIAETPGALFYTIDEENGIQLPVGDENYINPGGLPRPQEIVFQAFIEPVKHLDSYDFSENSLRAFSKLGEDMSREVARSRFNAFRAAWVYDTDDESFVISDRALGPLLAERAATLGAGRFAVGFSYRQVNWDRLNGEKLNSFTRRINHQDKDGDGFLTGAETDYIDVALRVKVEQDFVDFFLEYGLTNSIDIGIVLPIVQTNMQLDASATIHWGGDDPSRDVARGAGTANEWTEEQSRREHFFCRLEGGAKVPMQLTRFLLANNRIYVPADPVRSDNSPNIIGGKKGCPNRRGDVSFGSGTEGFQGPARDHKTERAIGIGDVRLRAKWHALESNGLIPDLAWLTELKPPTGVEDDYHGTGALSASNYIVGGWHFWRFHPHFNAGIEISTGPRWQDAGEWIVGTDIEIFEWLGASVDYLGRKPFDNKVADRHEIGGGVKLVPVPGFALSFDAIFPLNKNEGLTSNMIWRFGGQFQF